METQETISMIMFGVSRLDFNGGISEEGLPIEYSESQFKRFQMSLKNALLREYPEAAVVVYESSFKDRDEVQCKRDLAGKPGGVMRPSDIKRLLSIKREIFSSKNWR